MTPTSSRPRWSPWRVSPIAPPSTWPRRVLSFAKQPVVPTLPSGPLVLMAALLTLVMVACSPNSAAVGDTDVFCQTARDNQELLLNPPLSTPYEVDETIKFYDQMGKVAPLAIADDWNQLVDAMRTANKLVPGNEDSEQLVAKTAFASELAAYNVAQWLRTNCGVDLPITTIVPHDPAVALSPNDSAPASPTAATGPANTTVPPDANPASTSTP